MKRGTHTNDIAALATQANKDPKARQAFMRRYTFSGFSGGQLSNREKTLFFVDTPKDQVTK